MICYDKARYMDALSTPCGHYYCQDCTVDFAKAFTLDESLFPLRCCEGRIPITDFVPFLSDDLRMLFEEKNDEFSVPSSGRAYCANPTCSKFLGSSTSKHSITIICPDCEAITCLECKQTHEGVNCPVNEATKRLHALAQEKGWQTCPGCHALVELSIGCHHIICRCKAQFCYLCGVNWKSCECPQFAEARLIDPAFLQMQRAS
ncbi:hypothetical protein CPB84DRAFT_660014 [Gymnopilus junonius]|uniref:RBR-type E3 ubiquitin transferase n=1 Tax=Gymnopilus junonius TaxID=109634 RepID=A0A9P5TGP1_GYMJU|nr:hypothetical protein CPB84DRAFT_660014 [Gymnopilus junonius]